MDDPRHVLAAGSGGESFECPRCGRISHNPADKREGYCGACNQWTGDLALNRMVVAYDPLGIYCAAGRRVLGVTTPNDLNWTEPCPGIPSGRHVIDFRGAGQVGGIGKLSFCRAHGQVFLGDIQRWLALWSEPPPGGGEPGVCRHCGDATELGDDPAPGLCCMCAKVRPDPQGRQSE